NRAAQERRSLRGPAAPRRLQLQGNRRHRRHHREQRGGEDQPNQVGAGRQTCGGNTIMNLDELMSVWRSQDAAPLHGFNETQLWLGLPQDEAKRQAWRRIERWIIFVMSAAVVAGMALFLANMTLLMICRDDMNGLTGWDLALPVVGAVAAMISGRAIYVGHRAQALREQSFGESLRDQLNRSIAQLDYQATTLRGTLMLVIVQMGGICPIAL